MNARLKRHRITFSRKAKGVLAVLLALLVADVLLYLLLRGLAALLVCFGVLVLVLCSIVYTAIRQQRPS